MRLFQIIFYIIAFTIGGCFAFQRNVQFPHRIPKHLRPIQQPYSSGDAFCAVVDTPERNDEPYVKGKVLFKSNCAICHNRNMKDHMTGPALGGVTARWSDYPQEDLHRWIRNAPAMVDEGHPYGKKLWKEWNQTTMPAFLNLTDEEIGDLLYFIEETYR